MRKEDERLFAAVRNDDIERARVAITSGADVNGWDDNQLTPLHWAAEGCHAELIRLLIENGANINARNRQQETPLHWAAFSEHTDTTQLLIEKGAQIHAPDNNGKTALDYAVEANAPDVIALLEAAARQRPKYAALVTQSRDADEKRQR